MVSKTPAPSFEVEFTFGSGGESVRLTLAPDDLRLLGEQEVLQARSRRAS